MMENEQQVYTVVVVLLCYASWIIWISFDDLQQQLHYEYLQSCLYGK